jgi:hypothetical protein
MRPFLNDTILKFVSNNFDSMSETKLMTVIDFLTKCESYTFLFDTILGKMKKQGFGPLFLDCLEAFITKKKIKEIPKETLSEVMQNLKD